MCVGKWVGLPREGIKEKESFIVPIYFYNLARGACSFTALQKAPLPCFIFFPLRALKFLTYSAFPAARVSSSAELASTLGIAIAPPPCRAAATFSYH